jgi:hypothetical protein
VTTLRVSDGALTAARPRPPGDPAAFAQPSDSRDPFCVNGERVGKPPDPA